MAEDPKDQEAQDAQPEQQPQRGESDAPAESEAAPAADAEQSTAPADEVEDSSGSDAAPAEEETHIFVVRTTANREDQVVDFLASNAKQRGIPVYSVIRPHGMRGYIFVEAASKQDADRAAYRIPYAKGVLPKEVDYAEIEQMLEPEKKQDIDIRINDIVEIISGPFKREKAKVVRFDLDKEEVVVNLLEAAVSIPLTLKLDAVKVIRRDQMDAMPQ